MSESKLSHSYLVQGITLSRIVIAIIFAILVAVNPYSFLLAAILLFILILAELTDLFDGILARSLNVSSELGATLDPYSDSVSRLIIYWSLAQAGWVLQLVPLVMAIRDVTVAYCRIIITKKGLSVAALKSGKIKAWVQAIGSMIAIVGPLVPFYLDYSGDVIISWIIIMGTIASIPAYVSKAVSKASGA